MNIPEYRGRSAEEIILQNVHFDSVGYFFRAASWVDYSQRRGTFSSLIYACADARHGIEYLLFESLILSTGANIDEETYTRCTKERNKFEKLIRQLSPNYEKLKEFTLASLESLQGVPRLIFWDHSSLMKNWGKLSHYLHWFGAITRTTDSGDWLRCASEEIAGIVLPLWEKVTSGQMGILHDSQMTESTKAIWHEYKSGALTLDDLKRKLAESIA